MTGGWATFFTIAEKNGMRFFFRQSEQYDDLFRVEFYWWGRSCALQLDLRQSEPEISFYWAFPPLKLFFATDPLARRLLDLTIGTLEFFHHRPGNRLLRCRSFSGQCPE